MADVNAEIGVNIDTSGALAQLKALQREIARFHTSVARSSDAAGLAQRDLQKNFINGINAIQGFSAELRTVRTTAENFTNTLERNKFSMREYFRYAGASTKTFGRFFTSEFDTINKVAVENVKRLQTQYIKMGRDASGAMQAIAVMPTQLDMSNLTTQTQLAAQRQAIFNQLVKQGSTNLLNFGKNTQWAGRQLMVGFTIPLIGLGTAAVRTFMDMETATIKFRKVYGDLFTPAEETQAALDSIQQVGKEFTRFGIQVADTVSLAAEAAAAGFQGIDLQRQVTEATRLQVLGQIDQQKALETTISLQNAFRMSSENLADAINFLNAVENQTVVSLDDITTAIPKAAPIVRELGGDVKDLAFFMAAMKEGGINASEGANALKSGLASLINPSEKAKGMLMDMGINIDQIVESNVGNLKATVIEFAKALDSLSNLQRQRAIEQLFGKFQQARLSALFDNVIRDGNQASRVLDLANASAADLAATAEKELGITADSAMNKFRSSVEQLKLSLVPIGEAVLQIITPLLDRLNGLLQWFNGLSDSTKKVISKIVLYLGGLAPIILMTVGLMANFIANGIKGLMLLRNGFLRLTGQSKILSEQTNYLTVEQQNAVASAASLEQSHMRLQQAFTGEAGAVRQLIAEYQRMVAAQNMAATRFPGMMQPGFRARKYAKGVVSVPGPKGAGDIVPAMLSPGEAVIPAKMTQKYAGLIDGMISDSIPGFKKGLSVGSLKKQVGLYKAPPAVLLQTGGMNWETAAAEIQAVTNATKELGLTQAQVFNLTRKQASHIAEDIRTIQVGNETVAIKNWKAKNLIADMGYINNYVDTLRKNTTIIDNFRKTNLDRTAQVLNISMKELDVELDKLKAGIHPMTRRSAQVLQQVAMTDPGYQGIAARAGLSARLAGNFYETIPSRSYNPKYDAAAEAATNRRIARMQTLAGRQMANNTINALAVSAGVASPSRKTIPIGEDIARGLQVGMANQIDEIKATAITLSNAATSLINPRTGRPFTTQELAGLTRVRQSQVTGMIGNAGQAAFLGMPTFPEQRRRSGGPVTDPKILRQAYRENRMRNIKGGVSRVAGAGGGFGLSGLVFGLSMLPGKIGQVAGSLTGLVFAAQALRSIFMILPPQLKLVAVAAGVLYGGFKALSAARERERLAIEGIGRAANLSAQQIEKLGQIYGFTATPSPLATAKPTVALNPVQRTAVEQTKQLMSTDKEFQQNAKALMTATEKEADIIFRGIALKLQGSGAPEEAIKNIIISLQEVAGRTDLKIDFSKLSLTTKEGQIALATSARDLGVTFAKEFQKGYIKEQTPDYLDPTVNGMITTEYFSKDLQKIAATTANSLAASLDAISNGFSKGIINAKQFDQSFNALSESILKMPQPASLYLMQQLLSTLPSELAKSAQNIKNVSDQLLILKAASLGVAISAVQLDVLSENEGFSYGAKNVRAGIQKQIEERMKIVKDVIDQYNQDNNVVGGPASKEKLLSLFDVEIESLNKKRDALKDVNDELDRQNQYQMKQMDLINQASRAKISGNFLEAAQLQQQSMFEGAKFTRESMDVQLKRVLDIAQQSRSQVQKTGKLGKGDKQLLQKLKSGNYQNIVPMPTTPNVGFNSAATGFTGSTTTIGGSMYTVTMNISGENAEDIANKVMNKLKVLQNKQNKSNKVR